MDSENPDSKQNLDSCCLDTYILEADFMDVYISIY